MSTSDDDMIPMKEFKHIEVPIIKIVTNDSSNDISNIPIITLTEPDPDDYGEFRIKGGLISESFSLWLKSPKVPNHATEHYPPK